MTVRYTYLAGADIARQFSKASPMDNLKVAGW